MEDINKRLALYKEALKDYQLALIPLVKYWNNTDYGFCNYFKTNYCINVLNLPEMIELKEVHNFTDTYWFKQARIIPRIKFLKDVITLTEQKIDPDKYLINEPKRYLRVKGHWVNVYDGSKDGKILYTSFEYPSVEYMVRIKHVFDYTTYSHNYYYKNGLMLMGMIPTMSFTYNNDMYKPFSSQYAKSKPKSDIITPNLLINPGFPDAKITTIKE